MDFEEQKEQKEKDCTDCVHFGCCYLRRHRENKEDVTPCKDIESIEKWEIKEK